MPTDNQVYQSSNSDPTITYRTPTGDTLTGPLSSAPPQVQLLYQQLPQARAQTSTATSQATTAGVGAQAATQPLDLKTSLSKGMTLKDALSKYSSLMKPDDIFKQYLAQSPYGLPNESPTQLQNMGISSDALGKIGDNGSFADRWNTKQAVQGMRDLKNKWNGVNLLSLLGIMGIGIPTPSSQGYDTQRQFLGQHLSSLIPGSPGGQGPAGALMDKIPDVARITELEPGAANDRFQGAEQGLLNVKGYKYSDLGLSEPQQDKSSPSSSAPAKPTSGGNLLNTILNGANEDARGLKATSDLANPLSALLNPDSRNLVANTVEHPINTAANMGAGVLNMLGFKTDVGANEMNIKAPKDFNEWMSNVGDNAAHHPINTALSVLSPFMGGGSSAEGGIEGGSGAAAESAKPVAPGDLKTALFPNSSRDAGFALKDNAIKTIQSAGDKINGNDVISSIEKEVPSLKRAFGNIDPSKIDAWVQNMKDQWGGKQFDAQQAADDYDRTPSDKTRTGMQKERLADHQNGILRDAISNAIEGKAPGSGWQEGIQAQAKAFAADKGVPAKFVKDLPKNALKAGVNFATFGVLRDLFGGL